MSRVDDLQQVLERGLVAIIRADDAEKLVDVAEALVAGGIDVIEVTFTVPNAVQVLEDVRKTLGNRVLLGAGSVLDCETARAAILAGAEYIVSPVVNREVIELCHRYDKLAMPGAFTPTEVLTAWEAGADVVKIFPADVVGAAHLKALKGPLPQIRMMPTGGVNLETMESFFAAGACAVGLGSALVEKSAVAGGDMQRIQSLAEQYVRTLHDIRSRA